MTTDTRAALDAAIESWGAAEIYAASGGHERADVEAANAKRAAVDAAITAHVEAEVARRLAAAPEVDEAMRIVYLSGLRLTEGGSALDRQAFRDSHSITTDDLRAAIAADKARAVAVACPTPDEARRLVDRRGAAAPAREPDGAGEELRRAA